MNKPLNNLLQKEVTRQEFLTTAGLGLAALLGFGHVIRFFTGKSLESGAPVATGYGSSAYGGRK
jgi:hypothetical protein